MVVVITVVVTTVVEVDGLSVELTRVEVISVGTKVDAGSDVVITVDEVTDVDWVVESKVGTRVVVGLVVSVVGSLVVELTNKGVDDGSDAVTMVDEVTVVGWVVESKVDSVVDSLVVELTNKVVDVCSGVVTMVDGVTVGDWVVESIVVTRFVVD